MVHAARVRIVSGMANTPWLEGWNYSSPPRFSLSPDENKEFVRRFRTPLTKSCAALSTYGNRPSASAVAQDNTIGRILRVGRGLRRPIRRARAQVICPEAHLRADLLQREGAVEPELVSSRPRLRRRTASQNDRVATPLTAG